MSPREIVLLKEDFADLPVGTRTDWPLTAEGEYHVVPRSLGKWWFATIQGGWGDRASGNFRVLEDNGRHIVAHGQSALVSGPPMLVNGNRFWGDYAFEMEVRPLSFEGNCGADRALPELALLCRRAHHPRHARPDAPRAWLREVPGLLRLPL